MSKTIKKITGGVNKFLGKSIQTFDPAMDAVLGITKNQQAVAAAKEAADIQQQQVDVSVANAAEQARAGALGVQSEADRARALAQAQSEMAAGKEGPPTVELGQGMGEAAMKRKKFQGGASAGTGTSIRI